MNNNYHFINVKIGNIVNINGLEIKKKRKELKLTQEDLGKKIGVSRNTIKNYENGGVIPESKREILTSILFKEKSNIEHFNNRDEAKEVDIDFIKVPLITVKAHAGYLFGFEDEEFIKELPTIPVITDRTFHGKYRCFEVSGDSMDDGSKKSVCDGDTVLAREVKRDLWQYKLHFNQWFFVINHVDGLLIKQIVAHDVEKGVITCHSLNPIYGKDFELNLSEVHELYNVISIVDRRMNI